MSPCTTRWTSLPAEDGSLDAFVALPPAGRGPGLLLLQEIFGVNAHIRAVAEQYAQSGFVVIAPDLFRRQATRVELGYVGEDRERALTLMRGLSREQAVADMAVALAALRAMPECTGRIGALGYCMGGRLAFAAAALCGVDAVVCYYGGGIAAQPDLAALAARITVPVQFHHAGHDPSIPPDAVAAVRTAMTCAPAAAQTEFHDYPQAQHGFNCWARAAHDPASAVLAQGRSLVFLSQLF
ncbi:carboxymethylenebutenolidase [Sphaerotilus sulfidivorans]|uniref:Carboxymethylenebutenolidase n=1 Tax=Sphaerotilus sulfidivorans TaxID=639200 RepID=A0A5C1Q6A2_9BURK|nr:dienelactone hydrolase family protein [Sphaerotilus sulfidivorans]NZD45994.1 dienelactone hydrolase family protein [Sphaerotilus sulfidivorans]QEN03041.1 dienelactone hydrolase family protein [Sphaerotilus sulfidivorans]